jgi:hypothetical protein
VIYHKHVDRPQSEVFFEILVRLADGTGPVDSLGGGSMPNWSPDGRTIVFTDFERARDGDLYCMAVEDGYERRPLVVGPGMQLDGRISPDGRYVAYASSQSGDLEVYLTRFPEGTGRWQVSVGGGMWPRWNHSGNRLYFSSGDEIMAADIQLAGSPVISAPRLQFRREPLLIGTMLDWDPGFDVAHVDGRDRFLFYRNPEVDKGGNSIVAVQNWYEEFRKR